ncbi:RNA-directed DNA polymerase, eukaryota [Tanacetum coccineum]
MGSHNQNSLQSKFDQASRISKYVFVSNFPDGCNNRDLWKVCNDYGTVVDVFIPNKKSKAGKRFAFVRFIKVLNLDRLIENLNTIWIGRFHLFANPVRFERPKKLISPIQKVISATPSNTSGFRHPKAQGHVGSYVNVVNGYSTAAVSGPVISSASALVLDESCVVERDLSKHAMGKVKDVNSFPNLRTILMDEGFSDVKLMYLGGMWVMFEFDKVDTKVNMMQHTGVKSWFHVIQDAVHDFVSDERIVWVDIEGIPLNVWSRETFMRIGKKWGETLDIEDNVDSSFGRKRLCIKTKQPLSILESFKIIFKGKVLMVRAKELFTWNPIFLAHKETVYTSEDESVHSPKKGSVHSSVREEASGDDSESDVEEVSETIFGDNSSSPINNSDEMSKQNSEDMFKIYDILKKQTGGETREVSSSLSHPPGFTPEVSEIRKENVQGAEECPSLVNAKVMNNS